MAIDVNKTYDHFVIYTNTELLCCTLEASIMSYVNSTSIKKCDMYVCALSCPTLCCPMECGLPASSIRGIFQVKREPVHKLQQNHSRRMKFLQLKLF